MIQMRYVCCVLLVAALGSMSFRAKAYTERNMLQKMADEATLKDMLVLKQAWVPYPAYTDRAAWDSLTGSNKQYLIEAGEKLLNYKWQLTPATAYLEFERAGNRKIMEESYMANRQALNTLMLAELAEGKGRFIDQLLDGAYMSCEMTSWVQSAHLSRQSSKRSFPDFREHIIDLGSGGYGALMAWGHYFFRAPFDKINPVVSLQMRKVIKERVLDPYMNDDKMWWMAFDRKPGGIINNWNPWCNSNALQCFLLLEDDKDRLAEAVYRSMKSVDKFINYVKADGACEEGTSYWGHAAGKLYDYLQILSDGTGGKISLFHEPMIRRMGEYISRSYVGNGWVVNFADASARGGGDAMLIYRFGKAVNSDEMMGFAAYLLKDKKPYVIMGNDAFRSLQSLLFGHELSEAIPKHDVPDVTWYPETEFCHMKNKSGMFVAAKGGFNNESHNHNDAGTFSLYVNTIPVLIDAGVGTYTRKTFSGERYTIWTMQSNYHNLPMINDVPQKFGQNYKAANTVCNEKKRIFSTDIAAAYPAEAKVKSWKRSYSLESRKLKITDDYTLTECVAPNRVNFLTWGNVTFPSAGKIHVEVQGQKVELLYPVRFKADLETIELDDPRLSNVWGKKIYRIVLKDEKQEMTGIYTFTVKLL